MAAQERAKGAQQQNTLQESAATSPYSSQPKTDHILILRNEAAPAKSIKTNLDVMGGKTTACNELISPPQVDEIETQSVNRSVQDFAQDDCSSEKLERNSHESIRSPYFVDAEMTTPYLAQQDLVPIPSAPPLTSVYGGKQHETISASAQSVLVPLPYADDLNDQERVFYSSSDIDFTMIEFDSDGHVLSTEEQRKIIEEQRLIYERIQQESRLNDAAIVAAHADAFDERVSSSLQGSTSQSISATLPPNNSSIHDESLNGLATSTTSSGNVPSPALVDIGGGKKVSLYGTERTLDAIKEGTAILVQCVSCEEWMQLTNSATLMYCPKCKVISPVVRQSVVKTKDEAIRLTLDRKLAKEMQEKENQLVRPHTANPHGHGETTTQAAGEETSLSSFFPSFLTRAFYQEDNDLNSRLTTVHAADHVSEETTTRDASQPSTSSCLLYPGARQQSSDTATSAIESRYVDDISLWNYFSSFLSTGDSSTRRSAEITVSRPPSTFSSSREHAQLHGVSTGQDGRPAALSDTNDEGERLIQRTEPTVSHENANIWNASSTRVGERQPLISCVVESISHTAVALGAAISSRYTDVDGMDRASLLVHGHTPRNSDETNDTDGSYHQLTDH